jgi:hypothetical protein
MQNKNIWCISFPPANYCFSFTTLQSRIIFNCLRLLLKILMRLQLRRRLLPNYLYNKQVQISNCCSLYIVKNLSMLNIRFGAGAGAASRERLRLRNIALAPLDILVAMVARNILRFLYH